MHDMLEIVVDGQRVRVPAGITVAAALLDAGVTAFRRSVTGAPRGPVCGMGVCQECRVMIDGVAHRRSCLVSVTAGMEVCTAASNEASRHVVERTA
jgi:predicted molibdopterin-dependent oxidoreductase YjgC